MCAGDTLCVAFWFRFVLFSCAGLLKEMSSSRDEQHMQAELIINWEFVNIKLNQFESILPY